MNLAMFALIHLCVSINNKVRASFHIAHQYHGCHHHVILAENWCRFLVELALKSRTLLRMGPHQFQIKTQPIHELFETCRKFFSR